MDWATREPKYKVARRKETLQRAIIRKKEKKRYGKTTEVAQSRFSTNNTVKQSPSLSINYKGTVPRHLRVLPMILSV